MENTIPLLSSEFAIETLIGGIIEQVVQEIADGGQLPASQAKNADDDPPGEPPLQAEPDRMGRITVARIIRLRLTALRHRIESKSLSVEVADKEAFYLDSFSNRFGDLSLDRCNSGHLTHWLVEHPGWKSPHTKGDAVGRVVACFRWAEDERLIARSPFRRPAGLWQKLQPRPPIEPAEFKAILHLARQHNGKRGFRRSPSCSAFRKALWFLWQTGCRTIEMRELVWEDIDWDCGVARLTRRKTSGEERIIPLSDRALRLLAWIRKRSKSNWVFPNGRSRRPWTCRTFSRMFRRYADMAGVRSEVSAHCLRYGFCAQALKNGVGDRLLADVMGQAAIKFTALHDRTKTACLRDAISQAHGRRSRAEAPIPTKAENSGQKLPVNELWTRDAMVRWQQAGYPPAREFEELLRAVR